MNVIDALNTRYSCRVFTPEPVSRETLLKIAAAATRAPSWADTQPWEIFIASGGTLEWIRRAYVEQLEKNAPRQFDIPAPAQWPAAHKKRMDELMQLRRERLQEPGQDAAAVQQQHIRRNFRLFDAPAVVYLCMDRALSPWSMFDLGSLATCLMLAAQEEGLGSVPAAMLVSYPAIVREALKIPDTLAVVIGIALGYCDGKSPVNAVRSPRRPLDEVVTVRM
jgi:nitroreductase